MGEKQKKVDIQDIEEIEDFFEIYINRREEQELISENFPEKRMLSMHLGGIFIECLVKYMIIRKYDITRKNKVNAWYSEDNFNLLKQISNLTNDECSKKALIIFGEYCNRKHHTKKSGHDFPKLIRDFLYLNCCSDINSKIDNVYNPLESDNECFIDLRYHCDDEDKLTDELFDKWGENFKDVHGWLNSQINDISIESYLII